MTIDESAGMRELADELEAAQTEEEHGDVDVPLEADEPEVEVSHPETLEQMGEGFA